MCICLEMAINNWENGLRNAVFVFTIYNGYNALLCTNDGVVEPASDQPRMTIHHDSLASGLPNSNINFNAFHASGHVTTRCTQLERANIISRKIWYPNGSELSISQFHNFPISALQRDSLHSCIHICHGFLTNDI